MNRRKKYYKRYLTPSYRHDGKIPRTTAHRHRKLRDQAECQSTSDNSNETQSYDEPGCSGTSNYDPAPEIQFSDDDIDNSSHDDEAIANTAADATSDSPYVSDIDEVSTLSSIDVNYAIDNDLTSDSTTSSDANETTTDHLSEAKAIYKQDQLNSKVPNHSVNIFEVMLLIQTFTLRHNLTFVARTDLVKLINTILGSDVVPDSKFIFSKVFNPEISYDKHFFCSICSTYVGKQLVPDEVMKCTVCQETVSTTENDSGNPNFFISISMEDQLKLMFEEPEIEQKLYSRLEREHEENVIRDIYDAKIYKNLSKKGGTLENENNFSITFNTDGAPMFKSNKYSIWPIQFYINELPPNIRYQPENLMLAGLWFGQKEPNMHVFLRPFVLQSLKLAEEGMTWSRPSTGEKICSKVLTICCCLDSVAKPAVQCIKQFNGYFGCSYCLHPGDLVENNQVRYTNNFIDSPYRTDTTMRIDMETAFSTGKTVNGVKSISPLAVLPNFDLVFGFNIDYMHGCLLGVARALSNLWFDSVNHSHDYYIGLRIRELDTKITQIKPPSNISRLPRPISDRAHWKANEWRNWLLFYSLPCLKTVLPRKYFEHYAIFVTCIYFFLKESITYDEVDHYNGMLQNFVFQYEELYGELSMTINVHLLVHLGKFVSLWGPLWIYSAFAFESGNGTLVNLVKGTTGVSSQIVLKYLQIKSIPLCIRSYSVNENILSYCESIVSFSTAKSARRSRNTILLGKPVYKELSEQERELFESNNLDSSKNEVFYTLIVNQIKFHCTLYKKPKKSNDCVAMLSCGSYVIIDRIFQQSNEVYLIVRDIKKMQRGNILGPSNRIKVPQILTCTEDVFGQPRLVPAIALQKKCVFVVVGNDHYLVNFPNIYEKD